MDDRRLPVYLLIDVSGSMDGEPIQAVNNGIQQLVAELRQDPKALDTAWISVITFGDTAQQVIPLTDLESFVAPELTADGMTALGPALSLLCECRDREVKANLGTEDHKGDYRPLVYCMTDGQQNEGDFDKGIRDFKSKKWGKYVFCAAGPDADISDLKRINSETVIKLDNIQSGTLARYFRWVTQSIRTQSHQVDAPVAALEDNSLAGQPALFEGMSLADEEV